MSTPHPCPGVRAHVDLFIAYGPKPSIIEVRVPCKRATPSLDDLRGEPLDVLRRVSKMCAGEEVTISIDTAVRWATDAEIAAYLGEDEDDGDVIAREIV